METRIYKITGEKYREAKKILEGDQYAEVSFARQGYKLREGGKLEGGEAGAYYVLIGGDEKFFKWAEEKMGALAAKLSGKDFEKIKKAYDDEAGAAEAGLGSLFG